jgi:hypothetical protein
LLNSAPFTGLVVENFSIPCEQTVCKSVIDQPH